ncbi:hypothetical protein GBA52_007948 [Prunus armeniaca]|nr:hypothetical protein GBA52_007948 [Prunus armeniaca]
MTLVIELEISKLDNSYCFADMDPICFVLAKRVLLIASNPDKVVDSALTILPIIMAKPAGGPSKRDQPAGMDED